MSYNSQGAPFDRFWQRKPVDTTFKDLHQINVATGHHRQFLKAIIHHTKVASNYPFRTLFCSLELLLPQIMQNIIFTE